MSHEALRWMKSMQLSLAEKSVLFALADAANDEGVAFPSVATLSEWSCASRNTVTKALKSLEELGLITVRHRFRENGSHSSNLYRLNLEYSAEEFHADNGIEVRRKKEVVSEEWDDWGTPSFDGGLVSGDTRGGSTVGGGVVSQVGRKEPSYEPSIEPSIETMVFPEKNELVVSSKKKEDVHSSLLKVWNEFSGGLPKVHALNKSRKRALDRLVSLCGENDYNPFEYLKAATITVSRNDFWLKNRYGLDNLLASEKYVRYAEQYANELHQPSSTSQSVLAALMEGRS